jgi:sec-independent protein translocase protein TatA
MLPSLGPGEMMVVMIVAVLLFGKRLPEVGRSLGKGIIEFKKGIRGIEDEFDPATSQAPAKRYASPEDTAPPAPKFEPPTSAPVPQSDYGYQDYQD